jgi:hypothetical protein
MMVSNDITLSTGLLDLLRGKRLCMGVKIFEEGTTRKDTCPIKREHSKVQTHKWGAKQNNRDLPKETGCKKTTYDLNISLVA